MATSTTATRPIEVAIVGAGFGGIGMGIALERAGIPFTIYEREADLGGVWRDNTYPGSACDVPSHLYSFSFEPRPDWSRRFATQPEILDYLRHCARKHGIDERIRFSCAVEAAEFDEAHGRWRLTLSGGERATADALVAATGQLSRPAYPRLAGIERFQGPAFHSARWDHGCELAGRRVGVIGTGASAIQFVPEIAPRVGRLHVFQRSAPYVFDKPERIYRPGEVELFRNRPWVQQANRFRTYWQFEKRWAAFRGGHSAQMAYARMMFRRHLRDQVRDARLRARLEPDYPMGCKRILLSDDWYSALQLPHVELVTDPIREVTPAGIRTADGVEREVDVLIFGTGFLTNDFLAPMEIAGIGERRLGEAWRDGAEAYLGITVTGFPNLFVLYGPNTNLAHNSIIFMIESQIAYAMQALRELARPQVRYLDVRPDVEAAFSREIQRRMAATVWQQCSSWYRNEAGRNTNNWPDWTFEYRRRTRRLEIADYRVAVA